MRKREFTSFDVAAIVRELKATILDSRVNNVYQLDNKTLLLKLHKTDKPDLRLVLEAGRRLHLTSYALEKPSVPPAFCMALRKYLRSAWLADVEQYEFERVIIFSLKTKFGILRFALELFGDGNIILVDDKGQILQALAYKRMRDRNILRGEPFIFAPSTGKNPLKVSQEEFIGGMKNFGDAEVVRAIARFLSIGGTYAEEVLSKADVDKTKPSNVLSDAELNAIFSSLQDILSHVMSGELEPCVILDEAGCFVDTVPFKLKRYEGFKFQPYPSFNEALDEFYTRVATTEKAIADIKVGELKREAERLKRIISDQEKVVAEAENKGERDKNIGNTIYAHSSELQTLLDRFSTGKQNGKEWKTIVSEVLAEKRAGIKPSMFFESFGTRGLIVNVLVDGLLFDLNLHKTLFENAAEFYERGKRSKQKMAGAKTALEDSRKKLNEAEAKIREAEILEHATPEETTEELVKLKVKHKEWFEKFRWFVSSDGFLVVGGKDAVSNEVLIKKYAEVDDIVFHADITGAPFVVVKTEGKKPNEQTLHEAGEFAAAFSRGWREGFGSVDVYWVKPAQLSKGGPSGEYVPHGAFVVSGQRNWSRGVQLKLAIGVIAKDGEIKCVGGPVAAVNAKTNAYAIIVPGDQEGKDLLKRVLGVLAEKVPKELREKVFRASIEEIREFVPYNRGRVTKS